MIALSRFFLFSSTYIVLLILSSIASAETEYFSMITFLITSLAVGGWLYYLHKIAIEPSPGLKEILMRMILYKESSRKIFLLKKI